MTRKQLQGFIIHQRVLKNSSMLVDCFTLEEGMQRCVAKGFRGKVKGQLPLFSLLWLDVKLNLELASLYQAEVIQVSSSLQGQALYCGLYINELLYFCLKSQDTHPEIYHHYQMCLDELRHAHNSSALQCALRRFEIALLSYLGFGLDFYHEYRGNPIAENKCYRYQSGVGFVESVTGYNGATLLSLAKGSLIDKTVLQQAKRLLRQAIDELIDYRPLKSRELFYAIQP